MSAITRAGATGPRSNVARRTATKRSARELSPESLISKFPRLSTAPSQAPRSFQSTDVQPPALVVCIDFGAKFTAIGYRLSTWASNEVKTIDSYPGVRNLDRTGIQVPTELWYPHKLPIELLQNDNKHNARIRFGHEVTHLLGLPLDDHIRASYRDCGRVVMPKLLFDKSEHTKASRVELGKVLDNLVAKGLIKKHDDVVTDFLTLLLLHTKDILFRDYNLSEDSTVEMSFAVPVVWTHEATGRMTACLQEAMQATKFGSDGTSPCNIFVMNEPEAHAVYSLHSDKSNLNAADTFQLADLGGATTDCGIYTASSTEPVRLEAEPVNPCGAMVGSSNMNDRARRLAYEDLTNDPYFANGHAAATPQETIESTLMPEFENTHKRIFDALSVNEEFLTRCTELRRSASATNPRVRDGWYKLSHDDMVEIFEPTASEVLELIATQYNKAKQQRRPRVNVNKILVVGGGADSPYLRDYLRRGLRTLDPSANIELTFLPPNASAIGVAVGGVLRTMNKENGPKRIPCRSIGVLRHIPVDDGLQRYSARVHRQNAVWNEEVGGMWIQNTIDWIIKKDTGEMKASHTIRFLSQHVFDILENKNWTIEERIYVSDVCVLDHFQVDHPVNKDKVDLLGVVEFDLKPLKNRIRYANRQAGLSLNNTTIAVEMTVIDRFIEFKASWPAEGEGHVLEGSQQYFSVASVFRPGTQ